MDTLANEVKVLKKQSNLLKRSGSESVINQSSVGSRDTVEGSVWTDVRATINKTVKGAETSLSRVCRA